MSYKARTNKNYPAGLRLRSERKHDLGRFSAAWLVDGSKARLPSLRRCQRTSSASMFFAPCGQALIAPSYVAAQSKPAISRAFRVRRLQRALK